ncbi:MAG TPA: hypothetical protein VFO34_17910 [Candidatus Acidoferrales bacterium]|nr:hypothetical protein [Candidatus Acidoferrales bacterium]
MRPILATLYQMAAKGERYGALPATDAASKNSPMITWNFQEKSCPCCGSEEVTRSRRQGFIERNILGMTAIRPYRCMDCDTRYYGRRRYMQDRSAPLYFSAAQRH